MKVAMMATVAMVLVACGGGTKPADTTSTATTTPPPAATQPAPMDSTVQSKAAPDTLVRGDGAKCVVRPAGKWQAVSIGEPYPCNWSK